jgi:lipopolysaccharide biosynthesis protein
MKSDGADRGNEHRTVRAIAFYLPQFHPIPENDVWWGPGFTEWTNVAKARRFFPGHYQPRIPGELGFYDLRLPDSREDQARLASAHGVNAFLYWHYWFGNGRRILERPLQEVIDSGEPNFPFCVAWANGSWTGIWHGAPRRMLIEQTYPGDDDYRAHLDTLLPALSDPRYVQVESKPLVYIFKPDDIPDLHRFADLWRARAGDAGLNGLYLVGQGFGRSRPVRADALDAWVSVNIPTTRLGRRDVVGRFTRNVLRLPRIASYATYASNNPLMLEGCTSYPCVVPGWDNTPRSGVRGLVMRGATPERWRQHVARAVRIVERRDDDHRIVFIKSWNEWAEGNYLEPDRRDGRAFLEAFRKATSR